MTSTAWTKIETIASHEAFAVPPQTTLRLVAVELARLSVGAVLVGSPERPLGIISERDIVTALSRGADPDRATAAGAMSEHLVSLCAGDTVYDAAVDMLDLGIRHVPVLDERGRATGMVSVLDLIRPLLVEKLGG